jgi:hypothetical protein
MGNDKTFTIPLNGNFVNDETADMAAEMAVENTLEKGFYFALMTLNFKFDPTIDQISNSANYIVTGGNRSDRKSETHALHAALI